MTACLRLAAGAGEEKALLSGPPPAAAPHTGSTHQMAQGGLAQQRVLLDDCLLGFCLSGSHTHTHTHYVI